MTPAAAVAVAAAGLAAGSMNVIVGAGSLVTFPTLLAVGYAPVLANVSNTVGLVPGSLSGVAAYRRELRGQGRRAVRLGCAALLGGLCGASLLLALPGTVFRRAVPVLIVVASLLMALQPRLGKWLSQTGRAARCTGACPCSPRSLPPGSTAATSGRHRA